MSWQRDKIHICNSIVFTISLRRYLRTSRIICEFITKLNYKKKKNWFAIYFLKKILTFQKWFILFDISDMFKIKLNFLFGKLAKLIRTRIIVANFLPKRFASLKRSRTLYIAKIKTRIGNKKSINARRHFLLPFFFVSIKT